MNEGMRKIDKMNAVIAQNIKYLYGIERTGKKRETQKKTKSKIRKIREKQTQEKVTNDTIYPQITTHTEIK